MRGTKHMHGNHVRRRLAKGEPSVGTWLSLPSPEGAEYTSRIGFDWLVVDAEHNRGRYPHPGADVRRDGRRPTWRRWCASPGTPAENFKRVLDAGAWGVVVPMVNSREEAERAVEATRYPPLGTRSVGGSRARAPLRHDRPANIYKHANDEVLLVLQIEHIDGVEHADEILSVPGVDACFIGPNDLAASMGVGLGVPLESDDAAADRSHRADSRRVRAQRRRPWHPLLRRGGDQPAHRRRIPVLAMASELRYMLGGLSADIDKLNWEGR